MIADFDHRAFLTVGQAAALAQVCTKTIRRWIVAGALPAARLPSASGLGRWRIDRREVLALLMGVAKPPEPDVHVGTTKSKKDHSNRGPREKVPK